MKNVNSYVFFDTETGGLLAQKNAVCEIALVAIKGDTLEKIDLVSTFIQPYGDFTYEPEAMKFTGITMGDLESGVTNVEACQLILDLLKKCDFNPRNKGSKPIFIAHNAPFDKGFLIQLFTSAGLMKELEKVCFGKENYWGHWEPEMLDSQLIFKMAYGAEEMANFKLGTCLSKAGVELVDGHQAINDTIGLKEGIVTMIEKLRSTGLEINPSGQVRESYRKHFHF